MNAEVINLNNHSNIVRGNFRGGFASRILHKVRNWNARRIAIRQLRALPESLLRDIGIERHQIVDAVKMQGQFAVIPMRPLADQPATVEFQRDAA